MKTLIEFQEYINKNKIQSLKEFRKKHKNIYNKYLDQRKNWSNNTILIFPEKSSRFKFQDLNSLEDFQSYIENAGIQSKAEFRQNKSLSSRFFRVVPKKDRNKLVFKKEGKIIFGEKFSTVDDFQQFIDSHDDIHRATDFKNKYSKYYDRFYRIIPKEEKKLIQYDIKTNSYDDIINITDLQDFINSENVHSRKELHKRYPGLYVKFQRKLDSIIFLSNNRSLGENYLAKLFEDNNINYVTQKTFSDLKNILPLRYDFYLPEFNILIEHHGEGHFGKGRYYSESLIINDKIKYEYALKNRIPILYYTLYKNDYYNCKDYFVDVITDSKILIQEINQIGLTS